MSLEVTVFTPYQIPDVGPEQIFVCGRGENREVTSGSPNPEMCH